MGAEPLARAVRMKSDANAASIDARVMRAIGASEKIARVTPADQLAQRRTEGLEIPRDHGVDQVETARGGWRAIKNRAVPTEPATNQA